jgi:hypothetical protein
VVLVGGEVLGGEVAVTVGDGEVVGGEVTVGGGVVVVGGHVQTTYPEASFDSVISPR